MLKMITTMLERIYKRLTCKHRSIKPSNITTYHGRARNVMFGKRCRECGKTWFI